ncbi:MAG: corrinoid protein [Coriobacteriales bacterium]|jgi:methylmalonyl-CoA mutase cobalamin-binding domain/chain|nr:corrinoid protein [Coriobacteriales bacterium]
MKDALERTSYCEKNELRDLWRAIYEGNAQKAKEATEQVLQLGYSTDTVIRNALIPPMRALGEQLKDGKLFIPEVLMSSRAMQGAMYALQPATASNQVTLLGTVVLGTVAGDFHDIGKNMVALMLKAKGFAVVDLGIDVTAEAFVEAIKRHKPDIVGISAMLTTTMTEMRSIIELISAVGLRSQVTIMIGGAPVSKEFAREIKADIYAESLFEAGDAAEELIKHHISRYAV